MNNMRALLFDLDGTLLDSAPDLIAALNWLRASEGLAPLDALAMSRYVSHGAAGILKAGMPAADDEKFSVWKHAFLSQYAAVGYKKSKLYEGIPEVLRALERRGIPWGIVTNKMESLTLPILESAGLLYRAGTVVCGDTLSRSKPDPAPVLHACIQLGVSPAQTMFAGDDIRDVEAGERAGTGTAAVFYGYGSHEFTTQTLGRSIHVHKPSDFLRLIQ